MFNVRLIQNMVQKNIENYAINAVTEFISATPLGAALSVARRVSSFAGLKEAEQLLPSFSFLSGPPLFNKLKSVVAVPPSVSRRARRKAKWMRGGWARSRQEWLEEGWKHDWRSQPRDAKGRWIPGRLDHPSQKKFGVSRRGRKIRRFRNKYRRAGRSAARGIVASWGRDGY